ncbi:MAG: acyltransferase family protein [Chitinophagaceae bacterium]|nr:acyltransferase family protein [Chitinophagaceae bacterium]
MNRSLSQKFRFFTFVCIALLAYVHGYNLRDTYLNPFSTVDEPLTFTAFFEYLFANGLLRFRIPMLFLISGYLYALYDHRTYKQQLQSRFRTLIIPFLLWSALGLLFTFTLQQIPFTADIVLKSNLDQLGDNRPYTEIGWKSIIQRWLTAPIAYQLWFLTTLFVFNLLYPAIRWLVIKVPYIWLPLTFIYFILIFHLPFIDSRGLFFFSMGVWIQKKNFSVEVQPKWFSLGLCLITFIGLSVIKTFMAFELEPFDFRTASIFNSTAIILTLLHQFSVIAGILAMWFGADKIIHKIMKQEWFHKVSGYSFFIFGMHVPLLPYVMTWAMLTFSFLPLHRLILYLLVPLAVLMVCIWIAGLIRKLMPKVYLVLTGGRGF